MSEYQWHDGVFNPACSCGGCINRANEDCERCMMHDWIYKQAAENLRLRDLLLGWLEDEEDGLDVDHYSRIVSRTREALKDA